MPSDYKPRYRPERDAWGSAIDGRLVTPALGGDSRLAAKSQLRSLLARAR